MMIARWRAIRASCAIGVGLTLIACTGGEGDVDVPQVRAADAAAARATYEEQSCTMCHGPDAAGTDLAPSLSDLGEYWDEERLVRYLEDPVAFRAAEPSFDARRGEVYEMDMPAYDAVPDDELRRLARWLLSR